jgi:cytochrome c551/c552
MFDTLSKDKKVEVMMTKVVPNVGKAFKEHNGMRYDKFGCATCHGPKKNDDPHNVLPKLTLSNGGLEKLNKNKPEVMKFMAEKVVPTMAAALGEKPYDPTTKQGFGCAGCHTIN